MMDGRTRTAPRIALAVVVSVLAGILFTMMLAGTSLAQQDPYGNGKPTVLPTRIDRDRSTPDGKPTPDEEPTVQGIRFDNDGPETLPSAETQPGVLPFTGGDVAVFLLVASVLVGVGTAAVVRSRGQRDRV